MIPIKNILYILCYASDTLEIKSLIDTKCIIGNEISIFKSISQLLIIEINKILEYGLFKSYMKFNDTFNGVKGSIDVTKTLRYGLLYKGMVYCEYDELTVDNIYNRGLKTICSKIYTLSEGEDKNKLEEILINFHGVSEINNLDERDFELISFNTNNSYYENAIYLCKLVLIGLIPKDNEGNYKFIDFNQDEDKMRLIFQKFIMNFYIYEQNEYKVSREYMKLDIKAIDKESENMLPRMETDMVLESPDKKIIIDTKYYNSVYNKRYNVEKLRSENLYQIISYLYSIEVDTRSYLNRNCEGILLYPMNNYEVKLNYKFREHRLRILTINLNQDWNLVKRDLINIIL